MKVLFLDIDGVLVTKRFWNFTGEPHRDMFGHVFDPITVRNLERVIAETGAKIVISSTWKFSGEDIMKDMWRLRKLPGEMIGVTPNVPSRHGIDRGPEIQAWLDANKVDNFAIVDDDADFFDTQLPHFVRTTFDNGLTRKVADRLISILNNENN